MNENISLLGKEGFAVWRKRRADFYLSSKDSVMGMAWMIYLASWIEISELDRLRNENLLKPCRTFWKNQRYLQFLLK